MDDKPKPVKNDYPLWKNYETNRTIIKININSMLLFILCLFILINKQTYCKY